MARLTINGVPETFRSELPDGVDGDVSILAKMTFDNVEEIDIDNDDDYEGNLDAEYRVYLKDGDEIAFDGYSGLWELKRYMSLSDKMRAEAIEELRGVIQYNVDQIKRYG